MSSLRLISRHVRNMSEPQLSMLTVLAADIQEELRQGAVKPYRDVIEACWGDLHSGGLKPLTFVRQVLATCFYPQLLESSKLPPDVKRRAEWLLERCDGGSVGSYTLTAGIDDVVQGISEFIRRRDGGVPSRPEDIFISSGSQQSLTNVLKVLVDSEASPRAGVLVPVPGYNTAVCSVVAQGAVAVPYFLCEEEEEEEEEEEGEGEGGGWTLKVEELQRALDSAEGVCNPVALYVINPGNPAGLVQSRESMQAVVRFVAEKKLFLLADEVYQDYVHAEGSRFVSYKQVVAETEVPPSGPVQLASFHSASKGTLGECGLRGGFVELFNLDPAVMEFVFKLFSTDSCAAVSGQIALDVMTRPPRPGDPSFPRFQQETQHIRATLAHNVRRAQEVLDRLPGLSCRPAAGGAFLFPRVQLPPKALQRAQEAGIEPDTFYCKKLLEEAGVLVGPGCDYGQKEGTYHFRVSALLRSDVMEELLRRLSSFQNRFMKTFS